MNADPTHHPSRTRKTARALLFVTAAVIGMGSLLVTYGNEKHYLGALLFMLALSATLFLHSRKPGAALGVVTALFAALWPIDAAYNFPALRTLQSLVPFGPTITAFPSPSGTSTAYVYDYGFLDSCYVVRFSKGVRFPSQSTYVESEMDDYNISARWENDHFIVSNNTGTFTLAYSEQTTDIEISRIKK